MVRVISFLSLQIVHVWEIWTAYNPERHYMRGPGPKWREKQASLRIAEGRGEPPMRIDGLNRIISSP